MKLKFNRNVKDNGVRYEQGRTYDVKDEATVQRLLSLTHTDVFVRLREGDVEDSIEVKLVEVAPEGATVDAQPAPTPAPEVAPVSAPMPPAPNVEAETA